MNKGYKNKPRKGKKKNKLYNVFGFSGEDPKEATRLRRLWRKNPKEAKKQTINNRLIERNTSTNEKLKRKNDFNKYGIGSKHGEKLSHNDERILFELQKLELSNPGFFKKEVNSIKNDNRVKEKHKNRTPKDLKKVMGIDPGEKHLTCVNFKSDLENCHLKFHKHLGNRDLSWLRQNNHIFLSRVAEKIINTCLESDIDTIVMGWDEEVFKSTESRREANPSFFSGDEKVKNFQRISLYDLYLILEKKTKKAAIDFIKTNEFWTSKKSFVTQKNGERGKVFKYTYKKGEVITCNPDINAAYNIVQKWFKSETNNLCQSGRYKMVVKGEISKDIYLDCKSNKEDLETEIVNETTILQEMKSEMKETKIQNEGSRSVLLETKNKVF